MNFKTILFVHGMYMNSLCWEKWNTHYQGKGYTCLAPDWPGRDQPIDVLRRNHPDPQLGQLSLREVVEHFADIIKTPHPPLLLVAGSADNLIPASLNKSNYAKYKQTSSVTDFKEFAGRTHFIIGQNNWEEVADFILVWLNEKGV